MILATGDVAVAVVVLSMPTLALELHILMFDLEEYSDNGIMISKEKVRDEGLEGREVGFYKLCGWIVGTGQVKEKL